MKENWAKPGMPPEEYEVLDRWVLPHSKDAEMRTEWIWVKGIHPHLGFGINGISGKETFVEIYIYDGVKEKRTKDFYNLPKHHPLYPVLNKVNI